MMRAIVLVVTLAGCSFAFTTRPVRTSSGELLCTTSHAPVIVDGVAALLAFALGTFVITEEVRQPGAFVTDSGRNDGTPILVAAIATGVVFTAAALYGHRNVGACR